MKNKISNQNVSPHRANLLLATVPAPVFVICCPCHQCLGYLILLVCAVCLCMLAYALIKFINEKPIGFLKFMKRQFNDKKIWSLDDFFVMCYYRGKGIGTELFSFSLNYFNLKEYDIVYAKPSEDLINFLKGRKIDIEKISVW